MHRMIVSGSGVLKTNYFSPPTTDQSTVSKLDLQITTSDPTLVTCHMVCIGSSVRGWCTDFPQRVRSTKTILAY